MHRRSLSAFGVCVLFSCRGAQFNPPAIDAGPCALQGTWRLEGMFVEGKPVPFGRPHLKVVNATHFAVVEQLSDSVPSPNDSTKRVPRAGSVTWGAAGRYSLNGNDYVEHIDVFGPKQWVGKDVHAKCEVVADLWYLRLRVPGTTTIVEERYRRVQTSPTSFPVNSVADAEVVRNTERERLRSLVSGNMDRARQLHAEDFQVVNPLGRSLSKEQYLNSVASGESDYLYWEPDTISVRLYEGAAFIRYRSEAELVARGQKIPRRAYWNIGLYEKRNSRWQIVWFQVTEVK